MPFFALVAVGYIAGRSRIISPEGNQGLMAFAYWFAIPAMLFRGMAARRAEEFADLRLLLVYALSTMILFFAVRAITLRAFKLAPEYGIFHGFAAAQSNNGFLAIPLMPALFGEQAIAPLAMTLFADLILLYPLGIILADFSTKRPASPVAVVRSVLRSFYLNPFLIALAGGGAIAVAGIKLPAPLSAFINLLGNAGAPVALFVLGASLALYSAGRGASGQIAMMNIAKLALHPLLILGLGTWVIPLAALDLRVGIAVAALPTGISIFLIAQRYVANVGIYSTAILSSTTIAVISFSAVVYWVTRP